MRNKHYLKPRPFGRLAARCLLLVLMLLPQMAWADDTKTVYYNEANGTVKSCEATAIEGKDAGSTYTLSAGYYYVLGNITVSAQMLVSGSVHLILLDGCELNAKGCIIVEGDNSLTITAGNTSETISGSGTLTVTDDYNVAYDGTPKDGRGNDGDNARIGSREGQECGSITINGGTVFAYSTYGGSGSIYGADLGSGYDGNGGTITINGGKVHAWGGYSDVNSMSAAAIGSGYKTSGCGITININGGYTDAYCTGGKYESFAAGIGTGENAKSPATINITGGTVHSYSSSAYKAYGAGIGTGQTYESKFNTEINISGGTVTAYSSHNGADEEGYGAGIGMGEDWSSSNGKVNITITGGTVKGISGNYRGYGSGIGGGQNGGCGEIKISGSANVSAYNCSTSNSATYASGIGDGESPVGGTLTITGDQCVVDTWGNYGIGDKEVKFTATITPQYGSLKMDGGSSYDSATSYETTDESKTLSEGTNPWCKVTFSPKQITVTYDANDGEGDEYSSTGDADAYIVQENLFTRDGGYAFGGWNTSADGTGTAYAVGETINSDADITLYAQWDYMCYYLTAEGTTKYAQCHLLHRARAKSTKELDSGLWVVKDWIWSTVRLYVNTNDVTLILLDGVKLDASLGGIEVRDGGTLTITTGNTTQDIAGTGRLTATGGDSQAGIGGGRGSSCGTVNIIGGTVIASSYIKGVSSGSGNGGAAGIGGGFCGSGGIVNIFGGTVTANGGNNGAGIGGGYNFFNDPVTGSKASGGAVTISGGTVTATGGECAAGIGGGADGSGGTVNITGGTVKATGGKSASAIGGGSGGSKGTLAISGTADVTVKSTTDGVYALYCETATAKPNEGYSVYVQDKNKEDFTGTPSISQVDLVGFTDLNDEYPYAHIFFAETEPIDVTIGTTGWASLYYGNYNLEIPEGVTAYIVTAANTTEHTLTKKEVTGIIPAGTAVMLYDGDTEQSKTYTFNVTSETNSADLTGNILRGYDKEKETATDDGTTDGYYFYKLSRNSKREAGSVGFYWDNSTGAPFTMPAHKAFMYLKKDEAAGARSFLLNGSDDVTTGIRQTEGKEKGTIYDLNGRVRGTNADGLPKGIYIKDGKKIVID